MIINQNYIDFAWAVFLIAALRNSAVYAERMSSKKKVPGSPALATAMAYVIRTDRTPKYKVGQPNLSGDNPNAGDAWQTPRE